MKSADILALAGSIKPTIVAAFDQAIGQVMERIKKLEADLATSERRVVELEAKSVVPVDLEAFRKLIPTAEQVAELVPHGKDADPEVIKTIVADAVAGIPRIDGKDADPELVKALVADAVKALPVPKDGKDADPEVIEALVVKHVAAIPRIEGKPGDSVTVEQLAPLVDEVVARSFAGVRVPQDGKDGVGLAGGFINHEGALTITLTDGTVKELGKVVGGRGEDGIKADDFDVVNNDDHFIVKLKVADRFIEKRIEKASVADFYRGVWSPGLHVRGSLVTWGGSLWMAQCDTEVKPETKDTDDWKLVVKRGRDGKDFTPTGGK